MLSEPIDNSPFEKQFIISVDFCHSIKITLVICGLCTYYVYDKRSHGIGALLIFLESRDVIHLPNKLCV